MAIVSPFSALLSAKVEVSGSSVPSLYSLISFGSCVHKKVLPSALPARPAWIIPASMMRLGVKAFSDCIV